MDEELEFYTDLALQETERWIEVVTRLKFKYEDDPRKSLENGQLLCELLNKIKPGAVKKINRLPTTLAGLDNLNVFLDACRCHFHLKDSQLFDPHDLEDLSNRAVAEDEDQLQYETERRLRNVAITVYWLGKTVKKIGGSPALDLSAFSELVNQHSRGKLKATLPTISETEQTSLRVVGDLDGSSPRLSPADSYGNILHLHLQSPQGSVGSSAYSSCQSEALSPQSPSDGREDIAQPASDGLKSEQRGSEVADNMPGRFDDGRRHSYGGKPESNFSMQDSLYDESGQRGDSQYKSNPSLNDSLDSRDGYDKYRYGSHDAIHNRFSSGESLEHHSRQSSSGASGDFIPTRPKLAGSSNPPVNPLQFIKAGQANPLAVQAKSTAEIMESQKKVRPVVKEVEDDWQSNLSSWKMKMRRKSHSTHPTPRDIEKTEEDAASRKKSKTFKEMMEERERRKSGNYGIYPFGEQDDLSRSSNDHTSAELTSREDNIQKEEEESVQRTRPKRRNYGFYQDLEEDEVFSKKDKEERSKKPEDTGYSDWRKKHSSELPAKDEVGTRKWENNGLSSGQYGMNKNEIVAPLEVKRESPQSESNGDIWEKAERLVVAKGGKSPRDKAPSQAWSWERKIVTEEVKKENVTPWAKDSLGNSNTKDTSPLRSRVRDIEENKENQVKANDKVKPWERSARNWQETKERTPDRDAKTSFRTVSGEVTSAQSASAGPRSNKFDSIRHSFEKTKSQEEDEDKSSSRRVGKLDTPSWIKKSSEDLSGGNHSRWKKDNGEEFKAVRNVRDQWKRTEDEKKDDNRPSPSRDEMRSQKFDTKSEFKDVSNVRDRWRKTEEENHDNRRPSEDWRARRMEETSMKTDWKSTRNDEDSNQNKWGLRETRREENNNSEYKSKTIEEDYSRKDFGSRNVEDNQKENKWRSRERPERSDWRNVGKSKDAEERSSGYERVRGEDTVITQRVQEERVVPERELTARSAPPTMSEPDPKFMEKVIKISQKPNHPKGFGFTIKGGKEKGSPIMVEKVSLGSAADVCELLAGDEVISINGAEVGSHYRESVMHVIDKAVGSGQLELRVKRYLEEDEDDFDDDFEEEIKPKVPESQGRDSPASVESMNSEEERLEQKIMEDLEREAQREEAMEKQHRHTLTQEASQKPQPREPMEGAEDEDEDEPPPLPSAPPPAPNWSTFPSGATPQSTDSFLDSSGLLPDTSLDKKQSFSTESRTPPENNDKPPMERMDSVTRLRTDILRRKSEFLGMNVEDTEEYKKLQAEKQHDAKKKEENVWQKIENKEFIASTSTFTIDPKNALPERVSSVSPPAGQARPLDDLWQHVETSTQESSQKPKPYSSVSLGHRTRFDLEKQEQEIIENLEREEAARKRRQREGLSNSQWKPSGGQEQDKLRAWKSMEVLKAGSLNLRQEESVIPQRSRDMESAIASGRTRGSRGIFSVDEDKRKMAEWNKEQERRLKPTDGDTYKVETTINLQEKFQEEQKVLQKRYNEDLRKSEEAETQRKETERRMLEKEIARQQEADAKRREYEELERRRREEEERKLKEDEEQRKKWQQEKLFLEGLATQNTDRNTNVKYPWSGSTGEMNSPRQNREREHNKLEEERLRAEQERIQQMETERIHREEQEARQLKEKEDQLRAMEERIKREAEQLRLEREQLLRQKEEAQRMQSLPTSLYQPSVSQPSFAVSSVADKSPYNSAGKALYTPGGRDPTLTYQRPYVKDQRYPYEADHQEEKTPQFKIEIQTDPSKRVIMERKPASYEAQSPGYNFDINVTHSTPQQVEKSPVSMPVIKKPLLLKNDPVPAPKPSAYQPKQADVFQRRDVIELNKRPSGREYSPPVSINRSMEEITVQRSVLSRRPGKFGSDEQVRRFSYAGMEGSGSPLMSRDDILKMNRFPGAKKQESLDDSELDERYRESNTDPRFVRKSWHEDSPPQPDIHPAYRPPDQNVPPGGPPLGSEGGPQPLGRRGLHNLSAPPRKQLLDQWVIPEEERLRNEELKRQQKRSEIMRQQIGSTSEHWVVEEAERRRMADQNSRQKVPDRYTPTDMYGQPLTDDGYRSQYDPPGSRYHPPTHIMEHVEAPDTDHRPSRPIPEAIKQTLLQRVSSPRSPHGSSHGPPSPNYPYSGHSGNHYSHSSQSSMTSYSDDSSPRYPSYTGSQSQLHHPASSAQQNFYNSEPVMSSVHERAAPVPPAKPPRSMHLGNQGNPSQNHYRGSPPGDTVVAVSGRKKCSHCEQELGHGDAMIIESLGLSYHVQCFRCCVCHARLGTGLKGADVRVRQGKLHCQNCYSNDEAWFS